MVNYACAAGLLCGMVGMPISDPPAHHCMSCIKPMHGNLCGCLFSERGPAIEIRREDLTSEGQRQYDSVSALMCQLCINKYNKEDDTSESVQQGKSDEGGSMIDENNREGLYPMHSDDEVEIVEPPAFAVAASNSTATAAKRKGNGASKKKKDEDVRSHFVIIPLEGGRFVSIACRRCPAYNKPCIQTFNATKARTHLVNDCSGISIDTKRRLLQGTQANKRNGTLLALSSGSATLADMRTVALAGEAARPMRGSPTSSLSSASNTWSSLPVPDVQVLGTRRPQPRHQTTLEATYGPTMGKADAEKIILAEVKAIVARGEPLTRFLDDHVRAALLQRHPSIEKFLPRDIQTIYNNYVVPIDIAASEELEKLINNLHGNVNISMDGASVNGKQKVSYALI